MKTPGEILTPALMRDMFGERWAEHARDIFGADAHPSVIEAYVSERAHGASIAAAIDMAGSLDERDEVLP